MQTSLREKTISKIHSSKRIFVIGGGIAGITTALHLAKDGHEVSIIDPDIFQIPNNSKKLNGSEAALGVLMGYLTKRTSGRNWRLRKRSMELWPKLLAQISQQNETLEIKTPLIQLTKSNEQFLAMQKVVTKKKSFGVEIMNSKELEYFKEVFNQDLKGGVISKNDGRIQPISTLKSLLVALDIHKVKKIDQSVFKIKRSLFPQNNKWEIYLSNKEIIKGDNIVICAGLSSKSILDALGYKLELEPILGQAIDLELRKGSIESSSLWPAVINLDNINLILETKNKMIIGATIEPGIIANPSQLKNLKNMHGDAPNWITTSSINNKWYGLRARPINKPSPILEKIESGLIINTGHYRNGFLLAPACAEWVSDELIKEN